MAGNHSRRKGYRIEREVVEIFQRVGVAAERVPLSGGAGGSYTGDVTIPLMGIDFRIEVKCRANGFREIYEWIDHMDAVVIRADKSDPLIVLRLHDFADLAIEVEKTIKSRMELGPPARSMPSRGWPEDDEDGVRRLEERGWPVRRR